MGLRRSFKPTNIVTNGDFSNGTTGWGVSQTTTPLSVVDGVAIVTGSGHADSPYIRPRNNYFAGKQVAGDKYYSRYTARVTNPDCTKIMMSVVNSSIGVLGFLQINAPTKDLWYIKSFVSEVPTTDLTKGVGVAVQHYYANAADSNGKSLEVKELIAINLTATFGAGNEPDKAWCDLNIPNWFDGTLSSGVINGTGGLK